MAFDVSKGVLSGTPTKPGQFSFKITVIDSTTGAPLTASPKFTLTVKQGAPARLVFLTQPGPAPKGAVPKFLVQLFDAFGNPISGVAVKLTMKKIQSIGTPAFAKGSVTQATTSAARASPLSAR